jgi:hypothetical protein
MAEAPDLPEIIRRTAQANARFYKGWLDLSFEYFRGLSEILGGAAVGEAAAPVREADAGTGALVLEGDAGTSVKGSFVVTNDMEKPVTCSFAGSDFRDPRGGVAPVKAVFDPASLELEPGEEQIVEVTIAIDDALMPGVGYAGDITVRGMDGLAVPVVLRRLHRVDEPPIDREERSGDGGTGTASPKGRRAKRGTRTRKPAAG